MPAGVVVKLRNIIYFVLVGSLSEISSGFSLGISRGDQIIAYQGSEDTPSSVRPLFAFHTSRQSPPEFQNDASSSLTSDISWDLVLGETAVAVPNDFYFKYQGSTTAGTKSELLPQIANPDNWVTCRTTFQEICGFTECPDPATTVLECGTAINPSFTLNYSGCAEFPEAVVAIGAQTVNWGFSPQTGVGYCTQEVTGVDTTLPTIECPPDQTLCCGDPLPGPETDLSISDACDESPTLTGTSDASFDGYVERTYEATDSSGNVSTRYA